MKFTITLSALLFSVLMLVNTANAETPREQLKQMVEQLQKSPTDNALREKIIKLAQELKPAPEVPEVADRFEGRAQFAFKSAKSAADYLEAAKEYEKAVAAAPWVPGYYSDLCMIYEKAEKYAEARNNCEFFLVSKPSAQEARDVRKHIAGLEFALEKVNSTKVKDAKEKDRAAKALTVVGEWYDSAQGRNGWWFRVRRPASVEVFYGNKPFNDTWDAIVTDTRLEVKISIWGYGDPSYKKSGYRYSCTLNESGDKLRCSMWGWGESAGAGETVKVYDRR